jgi:hypothetical protein
MSDTFNPREHLISLKNRQGATEYLPVQWRLVWFRQECPNGTIETELVHLDLEKETEEEAFVWNSEKRRSEKVVKSAKGIAIFKATVRDGKGGVATGTKMEKAASFGDYLEKAETGSIGRALAALGYGTQFAPELNEEHRIVDSPVDFANNGSSSVSNGSGAVANGSNGNGAQATAVENASATDQQLASIRKLCEHLGKSEPENVTSISYLGAKRLIQQLTAEYREYRQSNKAS